MSWEFAITAFASIFAIVNPIGNIPFFVTVTEGYTAEERKRVIIKICVVMTAVLAGIILQTSVFGTGSRNYRIDPSAEKYITNFQTSKVPMQYTVEIWRSGKTFLVGSFTFKTVK